MGNKNNHAYENPPPRYTHYRGHNPFYPCRCTVETSYCGWKMNCAGIYNRCSEEGQKYMKPCQESKDNQWPDWYTETVVEDGWCFKHDPWNKGFYL